MSLEGTLEITTADDGVKFTFQATNMSSEPVDIEFQSGKRADVAVYGDDVEVWRWSEGRMFTQAVQTETIAPGETVIHEFSWENPAPREYTATATLAATDHPIEARAEFEV